MVIEAFRGQKIYSERKLWHSNSMFGSFHSAPTSQILEQDRFGYLGIEVVSFTFSGFLKCKTLNSNTTSNFLWPYFAYPCGSPLCPGTFQTGDLKLVMSGQKACEDFGVWPIYYVRFKVDIIVKLELVIFFYNCIPNREGVSDYWTKICMRKSYW